MISLIKPHYFDRRKQDDKSLCKNDDVHAYGHGHANAHDVSRIFFVSAFNSANVDFVME